MLYIANISETFQDFPDDESLAIIVYFKGCSHHCPGCHNFELQERKGKGLGKEEALSLIVKKCEESRTNKIVFSGGDPFYSENRDDILYIISVLENDNYEVCVYTGYELEDVETFYILDPHLYSHPTYLKCGKYIESSKEKKWGKTDDELRLATTNQTFYKWIDGKYRSISINNVLSFE